MPLRTHFASGASLRSARRAQSAGAVDGKAICIPRFDPDRAFPGNGVTDAGLRTGGRDDDQVTKRLRGGKQSLQARSINTVVIAEQDFHRAVSSVEGVRRLL